MNNIRVTVVIPCYNSGSTIMKAIQSIRNQTFSSIEILVVDDCSFEASTVSILSLLENDVKVVRHSENLGLPSARNTGFREARGDLVLFLDADDWYEREAISLMVAELKDPRDRSFVFTDISLEGSRSGTLMSLYKPFSQLMRNSIPYSILLSKQHIDGSRLLDPTFRDGLEDWELNLRLIATGFTPKRIPFPVFHYQVSNQGMFQSRTVLSFFNIWRKIRGNNEILYSKAYISKAFSSERKIYPIYTMIPAIMMLFLSKLKCDNFLNYLLSAYVKTVNSVRQKKVGS
jgi:glycosyltransferase involved in cell wall biosynthesis